MKKDIRAKLIRAGLVFSNPAAARTAPADSSFVDLCVEQILEGKSLSVKDLAKMFEKSPDWVLKNFKDVAGMFRQGKVIRYPRPLTAARINFFRAGKSTSAVPSKLTRRPSYALVRPEPDSQLITAEV